jgi:hypothetical protein
VIALPLKSAHPNLNEVEALVSSDVVNILMVRSFRLKRTGIEFIPHAGRGGGFHFFADHDIFLLITT